MVTFPHTALSSGGREKFKHEVARLPADTWDLPQQNQYDTLY
jgi:hypothetical protein